MSGQRPGEPKPGSPDTLLWHELTPGPGDVSLFKNRYSALIQGFSNLKEMLDESGIRNLLVTDTKTNVAAKRPRATR